jgi:hypothetical protein
MTEKIKTLFIPIKMCILIMLVKEKLNANNNVKLLGCKRSYGTMIFYLAVLRDTCPFLDIQIC